MFEDRKITPEREEEILDRMARLVMRSGLDEMAVILIGSVRNFSWVGNEVLASFVTPWFSVFGFQNVRDVSEEYLEFLSVETNVDRLVDRIEALIYEKQKREKESKAKQTGEKRGWRSFFKKLI